MVTVQKPSNFLVRLFPVVIFDHLCINTGRIIFSQKLPDLDRAMDRVIAPDKSADKTNDNNRRHYPSIRRVHCARRPSIGNRQNEAKFEAKNARKTTN